MSNDHGLNPAPDTPPLDPPGGQQQPTAPGGPPAGQPPASPPAQPDPNDPTQGNRTLPIGGGDGQNAQLHKPDGLPEHLIGQSDQETIDRLANAYKGARDELAKGKSPDVPEKADAYTFEWPEALKGSIAEDDQAVATFREIAHEHGFTQQQIDAVPKFFEKMAEKGLIEQPIDNNALLESLAPADFKGSATDKQVRGAQRLTAADSWVKQLTEAQGYTDGMKNELRLLTTSADGVAVIESLMRGGMTQSVQPGGQPEPSFTKAELEARVADPRNDSSNPKYQPDFAERTTAMFKEFYPG